MSYFLWNISITINGPVKVFSELNTRKFALTHTHKLWLHVMVLSHRYKKTCTKTHKRKDIHKNTHTVILLSLTVRSDLRLIEAQAAKRDPSFSGETMYTDEFQTSEVEPTSLLSFMLTWMEKILLNSQTFNCVFLSYLMATANYCMQNRKDIKQSWSYRNQ